MQRGLPTRPVPRYALGMILQTQLPYDVSQLKPLPGISPLAPADWLMVDDAYAAQMAERTRLLRDQREAVLQMLPEARPAAEELLDLVLEHLPAGFEREEGRVTRPDGGVVALDRADPMGTLGHLVQEDLCLLEKQGEPNGYIVGREAGGAFIVGARYGSGTLYHKIEGELPVYWTGPSIGLDAGANAGSTFVLVYNLYDTEELYERYPAGEGQAYVIGGLTASYLRKGDVVLIPIRMGAGLRLGINAGYMKFSKEHRWLPF